MRNFHAQLDSILGLLVKIHMEENCGIAMNVRIGNVMKNVIVRCPVAYIVGDCEGSDKLCGKYGTHNLEAGRLSHHCDCSPKSGDNPDIKCKRNIN